MVDFPALRAAAKPLREAVAAAEADLVSFGAETARLEREGELDDAARAQRDDERKALVGARAAARIALHELLAGELDAADPTELPAAIDPEVPLILLPVRLETRLKPDGPNPTTLLVRIFPDDVHVESHEPELTDGELQQGRRYWTTVWRAGKNENERGDRDRIRTAAWEELHSVLGPARARWVARRLTPANDDRPDAPDEDAPAPTLPEVPQRGKGWTRPATASTLPDRFVVRAFQRDESGNEILVGEHTGSTVLDSVQVGPDPEHAPKPGEGKPLDPALQLARRLRRGQGHRARDRGRARRRAALGLQHVSHAAAEVVSSSSACPRRSTGKRPRSGWTSFWSANSTRAASPSWPRTPRRTTRLREVERGPPQPDVDELLLNADDVAAGRSSSRMRTWSRRHSASRRREWRSVPGRRTNSSKPTRALSSSRCGRRRATSSSTSCSRKTPAW